MRVSLPEHRSAIPGFHISPPKILTHPDVDEIVTLSRREYIITKIKVDGSNPSYFVEDEFRLALFFVKDGEDLTAFIQKDTNTIIMTLRADDQVERVEIQEKLDDPDYIGATLIVWTKDSGEEPYFELHLSKPTMTN